MPVYKKINCPVCDCPEYNKIGKINLKDTRVPVFPDSAIVSCKNCRLIYVSPMPFWDKEDFKKMYDQFYFTSVKSNDKWMDIRQNRNPLFRFEFIEQFLKTDVKELLEIGAGEFAFMCQLLKDKGWNVTAQEPSLEFRNKLRTIKDINVEACDIMDLPGDRSYSLIYADSVLEHVPDPVSYYLKLADLLVPGGVLYTVSPNEYSAFNFFENIKAKIKGDTSPYICPYNYSYHLLGFTKKSLKLLANKSGLEFVLYKKWRDFVAFHILAGKSNPLIKFPKAFIYALFDKLGMGTNGEALFRKPLKNEIFNS